jgi:predicted PurR-regulated permease PerM
MEAEARAEFVQRVLVTVGLVALAVVTLLLAWRVADLLLFVFVGILFATLLTAGADFFKWLLGVGHGLALAITVILLATGVGVGVWLIGASVAAQLGELIARLPELIRQVEDYVRQLPWAVAFLEALPGPDAVTPSDIIVPQLAGTAAMLGTALAYALLVLFVGLFVASAPKTYQRGLTLLVPKRGRARAQEVTTEVGLTLRRWLLGQFISMMIVGVSTGVGLWLLGMPLALALGVLSGLMEFVPIVGPIIASIPGLLIALTLGPTQFIYVLAFYLVIQQLEGNVIMPLVQRRTVHLPPALTIVAVLVMERVFGIVGVFVATPILAVVMVLIKMLYLHDAVGEKVELPGGKVER